MSGGSEFVVGRSEVLGSEPVVSTDLVLKLPYAGACGDGTVRFLVWSETRGRVVGRPRVRLVGGSRCNDGVERLLEFPGIRGRSLVFRVRFLGDSCLDLGTGARPGEIGSRSFPREVDVRGRRVAVFRGVGAVAMDYLAWRWPLSGERFFLLSPGSEELIERSRPSKFVSYYRQY